MKDSGITLLLMVVVFFTIFYPDRAGRWAAEIVNAYTAARISP